MEEKIKKRVIKEAKYMIKTNETIRQIAKKFNVSKSTVHKDFKDRLKLIDLDIYHKIKKIIKKHKSIRHIKGGESTKRKYLNLKINKI